MGQSEASIKIIIAMVSHIPNMLKIHEFIVILETKLCSLLEDGRKAMHCFEMVNGGKRTIILGVKQ